MMRTIYLVAVLLGLASAAQADVSDSGNLTIGGQGVISGSMTVQGSAFSVGGATFSVAGGSVTLGGRLNAAATGIKWADGTTSTTAASGGGGGSVANTTQIFITTQALIGVQSFGPCIVASSITVTINSGKALVYASGVGQNSSSSHWGASYLINGAFPASGGALPLTKNRGLTHPAGTQPLWAGFTHLVTGLSAGSYTFCLTYANDYATLRVPYDDVATVSSGLTFGIVEIK